MLNTSHTPLYKSGERALLHWIPHSTHTHMHTYAQEHTLTSTLICIFTNVTTHPQEHNFKYTTTEQCGKRPRHAASMAICIYKNFTNVQDRKTQTYKCTTQLDPSSNTHTDKHGHSQVCVVQQSVCFNPRPPPPQTQTLTIRTTCILTNKYIEMSPAHCTHTSIINTSTCVCVCVCVSEQQREQRAAQQYCSGPSPH